MGPTKVKQGVGSFFLVGPFAFSDEAAENFKSSKPPSSRARNAHWWSLSAAALDKMPHSEPDRPSTKRQRTDAVVKASPSAAKRGSTIFAPFRVSKHSLLLPVFNELF